MELNEREKLIFFKLYQAKEPLTTIELSELTNTSIRTVKSDIAILRVRLKSKNINLITKPRTGIWLEIEAATESDLDALINPRLPLFSPTLPKERVYFITNYLIQHNRKFITQEEIANTLLVSKSTISKDLREVEKHFSLHRIELIKKVYCGIKIDLEEHEIRAIQSTLLKSMITLQSGSFYKELFIFFPNINIEKIINILKMIESQFKFILTDFSFKDLVIHLVIILNRKLTGNVFHVGYKSNYLNDTTDWIIAMEIANQISLAFNLSLDHYEISYLTTLLLGMRRQEHSSNISALEVSNPYLYQNLKLIFKNLTLEKGLNVKSDEQLFQNLFLHLNLALKRINSGVIHENPLADQISKKYKMAFELACFVSEQLSTLYNHELSKDEIGYIALYIGVHLEKYKEKKTKNKALIICNNGVGNSQLLSLEIENLFPYIELLATTSSNNATQLLTDGLKPDFILSTTPFTFKEYQTIYIPHILTPRDIQKLEVIFNKGK